MGIDLEPRITDWLSFVLILPLGFGIAFQLPLVMLFLERIGIFTVAVVSGELADIGAGDRLFGDAVHAERSVQHAIDDDAADWAVLLRHHVVPMDAAASGRVCGRG